MSLPLIQQANSWVGFFFCYIIIMVIYYSNTWNVSLLSTFVFLAGSETYFLVTGLPDVVDLNFLCQWIHLSSVGSVRSTFPTKSDCAPGGRPPRLNGLECMEESCLEFGGMFSSLSFHGPNFVSNFLAPFFKIGGLVAHAILFWGPYAVDSFKLAYNKKQPDVHYKVNLIFHEIGLSLT